MAPRMKVEVSSSQTAQSPSQAQAPKQGVSAPKATVEAPKATVEAPRPVADASKPAVSAPKASVEAPKPAVAAPQPAPNAPKPAVAVPQQTQATVAPASSGAQPSASKQSLASKIKISATPTQDAFEEDPWDYEPSSSAPDPARSDSSQREEAPSNNVSQNTTAPSRQSLSQWYHKTFAGHEHAFWGAVIALIVAILTFVLGPLRMLLICVLVFVGIAVGQIFDGDPKIIRMIRGLFDNDREER